ncbi:hypothetical protein METBIDRAFT_165096 [Metschnikowia bicuspidata var. bicuspidata NRRL YB-4993]|uniref:Uncharacterized protein n=1 Tax=Metschnikowia bicuspidata var. bicuspidata NRRL YB-4993 TaxID=869754 RepID=A0A1A0H9Q5_9ASCO|nr:hypothetical protein METBIDRAFT_165096 [Metschnikowia bicuspidata var. bicuspidata NRRL YB-4993]OBA20859.1 hypothetical protein METBIDRAFT_165096 [Metschnikowia bicuspidata var. bicuspidata NRRL YB-4993]
MLVRARPRPGRGLGRPACGQCRVPMWERDGRCDGKIGAWLKQPSNQNIMTRQSVRSHGRSRKQVQMIYRASETGTRGFETGGHVQGGLGPRLGRSSNSVSRPSYGGLGVTFPGS